MKVIVLTRGDLTNMLGRIYRPDNLYSDVRLNGQESAEAIVSRKSERRAERKDVFKL
ncbi:MAG: hypothetical protein IMZ70_07650 [Candidatus Atribacteria bacterium]|nr:hypothetical protein [Candidatus Atribacteria bacterium]